MAAPDVSPSLRPLHHSFPSFRKGDLQVLAGEYRPGTLFMWDQLSLFDELLWGAAEPDMFVLAWELSGLHSNLVVVVAPGTENAWILRVVLAPKLLWFGLHWTGLPYTVQLTHDSPNLLDLLISRYWLPWWPSIITWGPATDGGTLSTIWGPTYPLRWLLPPTQLSFLEAF
ncbi:uncharacterized protein N7515_001656 [Penicillium bovifimosum]|uniref:Uncharacterized protein n=1 Tax=Penicillium bovifimosum TaxID=126998 RepID=A0A9W9HA46_9EURO|nr:uncharacterized protein N7515_001656 [Penicillium bovifimosum]KAJ5142869.1 hypothetical protein N7515_001656 [Penicillium bovifimosum]